MEILIISFLVCLLYAINSTKKDIKLYNEYVSAGSWKDINKIGAWSILFIMLSAAQLTYIILAIID